MKLLGFSLNKISAEKIGEKGEEVKVNTAIKVQKIVRVTSTPLKTRDVVLGVHFEYSINYTPSYAKIDFAGSIVLAVEPKIAKDIEKKWEEKKMPEDFRIALFNIIFRKANIRALQLEDELGLPLHLPFPTIKGEDKR